MLSRYVVSQVKHNSYFLLGAALGLWLALVAVPLEEPGLPAPCAPGAAREPPAADEYEPHREERPPGAAGGAGAAAGARSVTRPRYYSTELGMRGALLAGVLAEARALPARGAALNRTAGRLQPALRFFIAASAAAPPAAPGAEPAPAAPANVVGFTDTREMLKPFHALKYLADNYLEEYDHFFLVPDATYVNARRLTELVGGLSVSQDVYMGTPADDESHYCSLESGILISNSVLRAVHAELDWCVRNSYSPHHHENLGRCILHAAHLSCMSSLQGESYTSIQLKDDIGTGMVPALVDAVTAYPATEPEHFYQLHSYVSRVYLERDAAAVRRLRGEVWRAARRHPPGARNATWPGGLRADLGLAPPPPDTRFDHLRWTTFNASHAFMPDDHRSAAPIAGAYREALDLVLDNVRAWAAVSWRADGEAEPEGEAALELVEGAWRWEPPTALRYRLLLRHAASRSVRQVEAARVLGAARLAPVPYVTESARVLAVLPVRAGDAPAALGFLRRYEAVALARDRNTALLLVLLGEGEGEGGEGDAGEEAPALREVRAAGEALAARHPGAALSVLRAAAGAGPGAEDEAGARALAACAAAGAVPRGALVLLAAPRADFNEEFLNRVRMNTVAGVQWYLAGGFARFAQPDRPRSRDAAGARPGPALHAGRFDLRPRERRRLALAFYYGDYADALSAWAGPALAPPGEVLARSPLHALLTPEPALVLAPRAPPCGLGGGAGGATGATAGGDPAGCLAAAAGGAAGGRDALSGLQLGARPALAKLLLELQAEGALPAPRPRPRPRPHHHHHQNQSSPAGA